MLSLSHANNGYQMLGYIAAGLQHVTVRVRDMVVAVLLQRYVGEGAAASATQAMVRGTHTPPPDCTLSNKPLHHLRASPSRLSLPLLPHWVMPTLALRIAAPLCWSRCAAHTHCTQLAWSVLPLAFACS